MQERLGKPGLLPTLDPATNVVGLVEPFVVDARIRERLQSEVKKRRRPPAAAVLTGENLD